MPPEVDDNDLWWENSLYKYCFRTKTISILSRLLPKSTFEMLPRSIFFKVSLFSLFVIGHCERNQKSNNPSSHFSDSFGNGETFASIDGHLKSLSSGSNFGQAAEVKDLLSNSPLRAFNEQSEDEDKAFTARDFSNKEAVKLDDNSGNAFDFKSSIFSLPSFDSFIPDEGSIPSGKLSFSPLSFASDDYTNDPSSSSFDENYGSSRYFDYSPSSSPYEKSDNENAPQKDAKENCVEVSKKIDSRMMKCNVCTDSKGGQSENCAYAGQPKAYFYSSNTPETNRRKREQKSVIDDPYEYIRSKNKYKSKPKEFSYSYYNPKEEESNSEDSYNYEFDPKEFGFEKSTSEVEGEKLMKDGKNCQVSTKDGMTCTVCVNPEGGNFEQCSYSVEPNEQKYAYVKESKFDGNGKPIVKEKYASSDGEHLKQNPAPQNQKQAGEAQQTSAPAANSPPPQQAAATQQVYHMPRPQTFSLPQPVASPQVYYMQQPAATSVNVRVSPLRRREFLIQTAESAPIPERIAVAASEPENAVNKQSNQNNNEQEGDKDEKKGNDDTESNNEPYELTNIEERASLEESDDDDDEGNVSKENQRNEDDEGDDDYHYKYFTEAEPKGPTPAQPQGVPDSYFQTEESKKDVEKVFAEFIKKDRSNCKQVAKNGMTCYLCLDSQGIQNEECMYISESQPKNTLMAYHEMQHPKSAGTIPAQAKHEAQATASITPVADNSAKAAPAQQSASNLVETVMKFDPTASMNSQLSKRSIPRKSKTPKKYFADVSVAATENNEEEAEEEESEEGRSNDEERLDSSEKDDAETEERQKLKKGEPELQYDINDEEGLFKDETRPVYSKRLGYSLPRFMLERSEHEESYDEFVKGRRGRN